MSDRLRLSLSIVASAALLAGCGAGGGGGGGGSSKPPRLAAASATTFAADAGQSFSDSDWGFPTSGTDWYRDHQTHEHHDGSGSDETEYKKRTAAAGMAQGADAILTTTTIYDEGGALRSSRSGAWTVGDNGVVYVWSSGMDRWFPFAPAHVHAGQTWTMAVGNADFGLEFEEQARVVSTSATSPNGYTGCIELDVSVLSAPSGTGSGLVHFAHFTGHTVMFVKPGVGTVHSTADSASDGTALGLPFDDHAVEVLEHLDAPPSFAITTAG